MYGCRYCKMNKNHDEYCVLTGELTKGAVMCDFEYEFCLEYQKAQKPIKPNSEPKSAPKLTQTSIFGVSGEKPFRV